METVDKRKELIELEEIYQYKDLINRADRDVIKQVIYNGDKQSKILHREFIKLVAKEINHQLNKAEFTVLKDELIVEMTQYMEANKAEKC